ncbi:hypothetical protein ACQQ2N_01085 [Dokdonella sp. MW10]|uniref:hypothetical protein n=1 Tax=Dokdonella sp. MW10 TaxID=2992926 RepID=UPI003F819140
MSRSLLLLALVASHAVMAADESYEDRWSRIANEHLALVKVEPGKSYERELIAVHNTFWKDVAKACSGLAKEQGIKAFHAVVVIAADGTVSEFLVMPRHEALACYEEQMVGRRYPAPPSSPFYELINVKLQADKPKE